MGFSHTFRRLGSTLKTQCTSVLPPVECQHVASCYHFKSITKVPMEHFQLEQYMSCFSLPKFNHSWNYVGVIALDCPICIFGPKRTMMDKSSCCWILGPSIS